MTTMHSERLLRFVNRLLLTTSTSNSPIQSELTWVKEGLTPAEKNHAAALMRINDVGEVCAQALYLGQSEFAHRPEVKTFYHQAAAEETAHLEWTRARLKNLGSHRSRLNFFWFSGAYLLGAGAALLSKKDDALSLSFTFETEQQVHQHLRHHLSPKGLPQGDQRSREIVQKMTIDEAAHAQHAQQMGGHSLPPPIRFGMQMMANVMRTLSYRI